MDAFDTAFILAEKSVYCAVFQGEQVPFLAKAVNQAVGAASELPDRLPGDPFIFQQSELHLGVNSGDPACSASYINKPVLVFAYGADTDGAQPVRLVPLLLAPLFHEEHTGIVGADPQPIPAVNIQAAHVRNSVGGTDTLKVVAVETDQAGIAADPDKAVGSLRNGVGFGSGQSVSVVVQHRGKAFRFLDRIDGEFLVLVAGRVEHFVPRRAASGNDALRKAQYGQQQEYKQSAASRPCSVLVQAVGHGVLSSGFPFHIKRFGVSGFRFFIH